jgi:hypothetical protein
VRDDNLHQILSAIDDYVFFKTIVTNIFVRSPDGNEDWLNDEEIARFEPLLDAWHEGWAGRDRLGLLNQLDDFIESIRRAHWSLTESEIRAEAEQALTEALSKLTDGRRLSNIIEVILYNARYRYLDLPWTRRRAKAEMKLATAELGDCWSLCRASGDKPPNNQETMRRTLLARADTAEKVRHKEWAALLRAAEAGLAQLDIGALDKNEGEWSMVVIPCARCSMWFAAESVTLMDTTCSYIN